MFENSTYITGKASENLENLSICIYDNGTLRKISNRDDLAFNVFVLIDSAENNIVDRKNMTVKFDVPKVIFKDEFVRCLRLNINLF